MPVDIEYISNLLQQQKFSEALDHCRVLCSQSPKDPRPHLLMGNLQFRNGNFEAAETLFNKVLSIDAAEARAWYALGILRNQKNDKSAAAYAYRKAIEYNPHFTQALNNLGMLCNAEGKHKEAHDLLVQARTLQPDNALILNNLGICMRNIGDLEGATRLFEHAISLDPAYSEPHYNLANVMQFVGEIKRAICHYQQAIELQPEFLPAYIALAQCHLASGDLDAASARLQQAHTLVPGHPDVISVVAELYEKLGEFDKALQTLQPALDNTQVPVSITMVFGVLCRRLHRQQEGIAHLEQALKRDDLAKPLRQELLFRLGDVLIDKGRYAEGFSQYVAGNLLSNCIFNQSLEAQRFAVLTKVFNHKLLRRTPHGGRVGKNLIFIVGMPRSGTSLAEQILAAHPYCQGGGELTFLAEIAGSFPKFFGTDATYPNQVATLNDEQLAILAEHYLAKTDTLAGNSVYLTDKTPHNFLHLGFIQLLFPSARVIHCTRDARDTCLSIYSHNFNANHPYAVRLDTLGWYYVQYQKLMRHWETTLQIPLFELNYESLISNTASRTRELVEFCGLPWDEHCMKFHESGRFVNTPSYNEVRQPVYSSSIGRWKLFEEQLKPLLKALQQTD